MNYTKMSNAELIVALKLADKDIKRMSREYADRKDKVIEREQYFMGEIEGLKRHVETLKDFSAIDPEAVEKRDDIIKGLTDKVTAMDAESRDLKGRIENQKTSIMNYGTLIEDYASKIKHKDSTIVHLAEVQAELAEEIERLENNAV